MGYPWSSLVGEPGGFVSTHCCPQLWHFKKNSYSTQFIELYSGVLEQIIPLQPICQAAEFKLESKFEPLHWGMQFI